MTSWAKAALGMAAGMSFGGPVLASYDARDLPKRPHIVTPEPITKRQRRRMRGKART
jgi:hypothetical protein